MYQIKRTQFISTDISSCWEFFCNPNNLEKITPKSMGFVVRTQVPDVMYPGMMIGYYVRPLLGIRLTWVTEITHVEHERFFVDEQRVGPYKLWHHEHHFTSVEGGVLMTDIVTYRLPAGIIGKWMHALFVKKKLEYIFDYRIKRVDELFPKP